MSENQDTGPDPVIEATVGINADGCFSSVDDHLFGVSHLRAVYRPAHTITWSSPFMTPSHAPATVSVRIGNTALVLTPEVWTAVNDAVQSVLPIGVVPA